MSSILKALKKLEDDKASRRPEELNIDSEILRSDNSPRYSSSGLLLASLLLLAGGSCATYMYMKQDKAPGHAKTESTVMTSQNKSLALSASDIKTEQLPAALVVVPANQQKTARKETPGLHQPTEPTKTVFAVAALKSAKSDLTSNAAAPKSHLPPLSASVKEVPVLRVNGIAFQDGGADSVAMINGSPATSGSVIDGVKIEVIYKNRVRFSYNGDNFEIQLGQSNR